jgi:Protein of unknown function (DUF3405)
VVVFILSLFRLSWLSAESVSLGLHRPKSPPPAWENFPFLTRYHGGIRSIVSSSDNVPEYPTATDEIYKVRIAEQKNDNKNKTLIQTTDAVPISFAVDLNQGEEIVQCFLNEELGIKVPTVHAFRGVPFGMPKNVMGAYDVLGLESDICFDRYGKLGPYGLGYSKRTGGSGAGLQGDRDGSDLVWKASGQIDYRKIKWAKAQDNCIQANQQRPQSSNKSATAEAKDSKPPRTAVIVRTWSDYEYDEEDLMFLRSLVSELSLQTGGEYFVHFLVEVKDSTLPIWASDESYQQTLKESLPLEFEGMGTLWSQKQMELVYNMLPENLFRDRQLHGAFRSHFMAMTWFAHQHPEFQSFWQIEMDMRYIGHLYPLFDRATKWAAKQPRKGLWERNARFYVPSEHGTWEEFSHMVRVQTEHGTATKSNYFAGLMKDPEVPDSIKEEMTIRVEAAVWGPQPPAHDHHDNATDIYPPVEMLLDKSEWGVDEEADLLLFNPIFDPHSTNWLLSEDITGYNTTAGLPNRRAAVSTFGRYSSRLLSQMHREMSVSKRHMFSEMFPATVALHHGLKAVYVPHPVFIERRWPTDYLATNFNNGRNGQSGGSRLSVFSNELEHNFKGVTWYYNSEFAVNLWRRWLGYRVGEEGGEVAEMAGEGRMCLPPMLLHPVKQVDMVYEELGEEEDGR